MAAIEKTVEQSDAGHCDSAASFISDRLRAHFKSGEIDYSIDLSELYVDSLDFIEALFELEKRSGRTLSNQELSSLSTVGDLVRFFDLPSTQKER